MLLPMLVDSCCWQKMLSRLLIAGVKGVFVVETEAAVQFMHDISKSNTAEAGLHLLAAVLSHENASRDAVAATEANALQVIHTLITFLLVLSTQLMPCVLSLCCCVYAAVRLQSTAHN